MTTGNLGNPRPSAVDVLDFDIYRNNTFHDRFAELRDHEPVSWHDLPSARGFWSLVTHSDVEAAAKSPTLFSSEVGGVMLVGHDEGGWQGIPDPRGRQLIMIDPPRHTRYRRLVSQQFTGRPMALLGEHITYRSQLVLDRIIEAGSCDLVTDIATELPLWVIAHMMGVEEDAQQQIMDWVVGIQNGDVGDTESFLEYARRIGHSRRLSPQQDLVSKLVGASVDDTALTETEIELFLFLLAAAGTEAPRSAISLGILALLEHPEQLHALRTDRSLLPTAVEEVLRWTTPTQMFRRTATEDVTVRDRRIRRGDKVVLWFVSANRDAEVFSDPFSFDISRQPNRHLTFGTGPHVCLGAQLTRLEVGAMLNQVIERLPDLRLAAPPTYTINPLYVRGVGSAPVIFRAGQPAAPRRRS